MRRIPVYIVKILRGAAQFFAAFSSPIQFVWLVCFCTLCLRENLHLFIFLFSFWIFFRQLWPISFFCDILKI